MTPARLTFLRDSTAHSAHAIGRSLTGPAGEVLMQAGDAIRELAAEVARLEAERARCESERVKLATGLADLADATGETWR